MKLVHEIKRPCKEAADSRIHCNFPCFSSFVRNEEVVATVSEPCLTISFSWLEGRVQLPLHVEFSKLPREPKPRPALQLLDISDQEVGLAQAASLQHVVPPRPPTPRPQLTLRFCPKGINLSEFQVGLQGVHIAE